MIALTAKLKWLKNELGSTLFEKTCGDVFEVPRRGESLIGEIYFVKQTKHCFIAVTMNSLKPIYFNIECIVFKYSVF